jgi:cytochrome c-type biogenesis protein CcmH/NrfG
MKRAWVGWGLLVGLLCVAPAQAQVGAARGKVLDDKGQPLEGAKVVLDYLGGVTRKAETTTNKKGEFTRVGLSPGPYRITASKDGFAPQYLEMRVSLGDPTEVPPFKLVPAGAAPGQAGESLQKDFEKAFELAKAGQFVEAEAAYKEVLAKNPGRPEVVWASMGQMYVQKKDMAAAEDAFRKAVEAKPDFSEGYADLAKVLINAGQGAQALEAVTKAAADFPQDPKMQFVHGWTLFVSGKGPEAEEVLKKAETLDPENAETQYLLGSIAVGQNKIPEAVAYLEKYLAMNPKDAQNVATAQGLLAALKPKK